ncbi:hypothetical protein EMIHUDRAFT_447159 [Emiliania huxleyi CCMP1516]|uniref:SMB domain-containing protein n=2 Tax=Emiliania huxleyi TaxID=2903 RepID=A0A0D3JYW1_EMIH1|nr:hypothetical protein EMIHUDRAFT_435902 [Emiliania huxleyi CCMP1516]XP_005781125.1 hypothetical protein EMIHUDRAFT_447159 [Emiliania huxleyi CCMP1516]EOD20624.1 hypothetical protein EMIHUDRAFT_435902 [Emiliania huxleyi CCMP1516]EOD28696.1 hypothetical protein EMIHUDRAFT_447159 [Emiliania huxleyi CCMP1516]|eukprot:XP_005773053.1 hypothetical protein EMIHUDRAFT_435902 [Emiliania huxleyi CCMP1516]
MLKIASLLLVALPASTLPAETVDDINPTARSTTFAPKPPPVPDVVDDPAWLIATSGFCSNLNVVMKERDVEASETEGDTAAHFMADIAFNYYPQTAVKFTDFPHHLAKTIEGDAAEADALVSSAWDHKNIALLEPTSTCSPEQGDQAWGISVFKVEEHRHCNDGETAWKGHPCVHYSGYVSAATSNFVNVNEGRFVCQLFVDSGEDMNCDCSDIYSVFGCPSELQGCMSALRHCCEFGDCCRG